MKYLNIILWPVITFVIGFIIAGIFVQDYFIQIICGLILAALCTFLIRVTNNILSKIGKSSRFNILFAVIYIILLPYCAYLLIYLIVNVQTVIKSSQVIYHQIPEPNQIDSHQLSDMSRYVREAGFRVTDVWFVRVLNNKAGHLTAEIFFKPQKINNRLRSCQSISYSPLFLVSFSKPNLLEKIIQIVLRTRNLRIRVNENYQISMNNEPFKDKIEIPSQNSLLPFNKPKAISEQEIIEIVDFYRSAGKLRQTIARGVRVYGIFDSKITDSEPVKVDVNRPIYSIEIKDKAIELRTEKGPLSEFGELFEILKADQGYKLLRLGIWSGFDPENGRQIY